MINKIIFGNQMVFNWNEAASIELKYSIIVVSVMNQFALFALQN